MALTCRWCGRSREWLGTTCEEHRLEDRALELERRVLQDKYRYRLIVLEGGTYPDQAWFSAVQYDEVNALPIVWRDFTQPKRRV